MPPRSRKAAPALVPAPPPPTLSLKDCNIAFTKLTQVGLNDLSKAQIESSISDNGGTIVSKIDQCTHFIASAEQYQKQLVRVKEAISNDNVQIVTFEWLEKSFDSTTKVDEADYILHARDSDDKADAKMPLQAKRSRKTSDDQDDSSSKVSKKVKADNSDSKQDIKAVSTNIPLDEGIPNAASYKVFVSDDDTIYDATLNQTNAGQNNNKFYRIQILEDKSGKHWCWTRWGRVGEKGQTKMLGNGDFELARKEFGKKFKDKNGNQWDRRFDAVGHGKYSYIERSYEDSDDEDADKKTGSKKGEVKKEDDSEEEEAQIQSKLSEPVQRLMKLIFNQDYFNSTLASLDYDVNKMPLGKLSKNTLLRGYAVLKDLAAGVGASNQNAVVNLSNQYFSLIPHAFGRNRPPVLNNMDMIKREIELLESLTDMQLANEIMKNAKGKKSASEQMNVLDRQFDGLSMQEMTALDSKSKEFRELENYLVKSGGHTHHIKYKVQDIFRIERDGEHQRFRNSKFAGIPNSERRLLWHGSRCTNFGGILSQGLRIAPPEAPVNGYMFGKGVYLADMSSKSANYCCSYESAGNALLLLCEAELGKPPLKLFDSDYQAAENAAQKGAISTWGVGQSAPTGWKDAGCVHDALEGVMMPDVINHPPGPTNESQAWLQYNEYIIYDVAQVKLRYLLRCQIN